MNAKGDKKKFLQIIFVVFEFWSVVSVSGMQRFTFCLC